MRKIVAGKLQTGADFEGSKGGCISNIKNNENRN